MKSKYCMLLLMLGSSAISANEATGPLPVVEAPTRTRSMTLEQMSVQPGTFSLRGNLPDGLADFRVRRDEVVTQASLDLDFTPSPALLPLVSQLKVYLNDELMGVQPFTDKQMGYRNHASMVLDPRYAKDFNRLKLNFIGHYQKVCENPASDTLWLNINRDTQLNMQLQTLPVRNELSFFPMPFLDLQDDAQLVLPMVFAGPVSLKQQQAAGVLASWFGAKAQWRGQHFPVLLNESPTRNAIVFATNESRPDFLSDYPKVTGPTIDMVSAPDNPYVKLLVILGRDQDDLITASKAIAQGNVLLRGQSVRVEELKPLAPRVPYDAPNWARLDRPMRLSELLDYPEQLQAGGRAIWPLSLTVKLPPDLYQAGPSGIQLKLGYHYTSPVLQDGSRLDINVNDQLMKSYPLEHDEIRGKQMLTLPLWLSGDDDSRLLQMPGFKSGQANRLTFTFQYGQQFMGGNEDGRCDLLLPPAHQVRISENSTLDFTGYRHLIEMPDLKAFSGAGFPFSKLADLSETQIVMPVNPSPQQITTLLDTLGGISAETGYPALAFTLTNEWLQGQKADLDTLLIGDLPAEFRQDAEPDAQLASLQSWVNQPRREFKSTIPSSASDRQPEARVGMRGNNAIAVVLGLQSPTHPQRSVVALLADSNAGASLLNKTMQSPSLRAQVAGSVAIIRESGVTALAVGDRYEVGYLPWWERAWYQLTNRPMRLAGITLISTLLLGWGLRLLLAEISRRRLKEE